MKDDIKSIIDEVKKVIIGKDEVIENVLEAILSRGHILLEDIPGVGKTTLAMAFSMALGLDYKRIQFTPDVMPSDVVGFSMFDKSSNDFVYKPGPVMTNMLLADEINRTSSKTQSALLEVMEEGKTTIDGVSHKLPDPFVVIATQNPVGSAGTQILPQSQLDRFMICLTMGYPDRNSQMAILKDRQMYEPLDSVHKVSSKERLIAMQKEVETVHIDDAILSYMIDLAEATRKNEYIRLGMSPRGILALNRFTKAKAYIDERDYAVPEDVIKSFYNVCAHRIVVNTNAKIANMSKGQIFEDIINTVPSPDFK